VSKIILQPKKLNQSKKTNPLPEMNTQPSKHPENVPGIYYVNSECIDCPICDSIASGNFKRDESKGYFYVSKQPQSAEEEDQCFEALASCPTGAIWNNGDGINRGDDRAFFLNDQNFEVDPEDDADRIDCPFCGKMHYPGTGTAAAGLWTWDESEVCEHLLFLALDLSAYTGFQYRSKLFNQHLGLPDSDDGEISIPSDDDPDDDLSVTEIINKISISGLELRRYKDGGGMACGPVAGGDVILGFVPKNEN
jgi:ferredoxin